MGILDQILSQIEPASNVNASADAAREGRQGEFTPKKPPLRGDGLARNSDIPSMNLEPNPVTGENLVNQVLANIDPGRKPSPAGPGPAPVTTTPLPGVNQVPQTTSVVPSGDPFTELDNPEPFVPGTFGGPDDSANKLIQLILQSLMNPSSGGFGPLAKP